MQGRDRLLAELDLLGRELGAKRPIQPEEFIDSTTGLEELDPCDVFFCAGRKFGVRVTDEQVRHYCGLEVSRSMPREQWIETFKPMFTWDGLAGFLLPKLDAVPLAERMVLGRRCGPAGAYYAIREVLQERWPDAPSAAPSDGVRGWLRGRDLTGFWFRMRWLAGEGLPELGRRGLSKAGEWAALVAVLLALVGLGALCSGSQVVAAPAGILFLTIAAFAIAVGRVAPCLPPGVVTMKDLSRMVWAARSGIRSTPTHPLGR